MEKGVLKASELRIGNLFLEQDGEERYYPIESIYLNMRDVYWVSYRNGSIKCSVESLEPIVLTEEWLLRMGGRKINQIDWEISIGGIKFNCRFNKKWYSSIGGIYLSDKIQYVHTFQNLIHALTGEELTIKEK